MKERGMIFNGEMVRAILDGRKTQTRRIVKGADGAVKFCKEWDINGEEMFVVLGEKDHTGMNPVLGAISCPFGAVGDRLIPAMPIPSLGKRYCADVSGCIWSKAKSGGEWRKLNGSANGKGYLTITPAVDGKYKTRLVHELVAEAFYGKRPSGSQIRHLDGNQKNNSPENLDYGTQEQNWSDRLVNGVSLGEGHHNAKITNKIAGEIRASSLSQRALSKQYGLSQSTIWSIKNNRTWVENPIPQKPNMPRWASRITLEITDVRVERLNAISEEDAEAEGINMEALADSQDRYDCIADHNMTGRPTATGAFKYLWESIYGAENWQANPWVWVIEFKRVEGGAA
jgi:hypothetical protein